MVLNITQVMSNEHWDYFLYISLWVEHTRKVNWNTGMPRLKQRYCAGKLTRVIHLRKDTNQKLYTSVQNDYNNSKPKSRSCLLQWHSLFHQTPSLNTKLPSILRNMTSMAQSALSRTTKKSHCLFVLTSPFHHLQQEAWPFHTIIWVLWLVHHQNSQIRPQV